MARKRSWSRYQAPSEVRNEQGDRVNPEPRPPSKPATVRKPKPKPADRTKNRATRSAKDKSTDKAKLSGWINSLIALAILVPIVLVIVVGVKAANDEDSSSNEDIDRSLLTEDYIGSTLDKALEVEGKDAVSVRLSEYGLTVEYFDPNARESRYLETDKYSDGYNVRVEATHYDDYQPRPFDLTTLDAPTMIKAIEDALAKTDDIYTYSLRIDADRETGKVSMVASVSGVDSIEITSAP